MLRFATPPDPPLMAIVQAALEILQDSLKPVGQTDAERLAFWQAQYPAAARVFSLTLAQAAAAHPVAATADPRLYQLTDYHWLLLSDALRCFCDIHNDAVQEEPGPLPVGPYRIGPIDFDWLVDRYFWDTDFLLEGADVLALGLNGREALGLNAETFGLTQGLSPHPDELRLEPWDEPEYVVAGSPLPEGSIISTFPSVPQDATETSPPPPTP